MKSVFITLLMFAAVLSAIRFGVFDVISSTYVVVGATILVFITLIFAFKILGNPLTKDKKNDENKN